MSDEIRWDPTAAPPQFTNNADMVIEKGTHVRVKIIGLRTEVGEMWAIGSINGDYLGYVQALEYTGVRVSLKYLLTTLATADVCRPRTSETMIQRLSACRRTTLLVPLPYQGHPLSQTQNDRRFLRTKRDIMSTRPLYI